MQAKNFLKTYIFSTFYAHICNYSAANKFCFFAGHDERKIKKTTGQIKFTAVTVKQRMKIVLRHSLVNVLVQMLPQFHIQHFLSSQKTDKLRRSVLVLL